MTIELRPLRHLIAIDRHGTLGRAAAALGMTQPALSRSVQQLEHRVGAKLLERSRIGVALTDEGRLLLRRAKDVVQAADDLEREVQRRRVPGAGQIVVGAGPYPGETIVPDAVARFLTAQPRVRVRVVIRDWDELLRRLRAHEMEAFVAETSTLEGEHDLEVETLTPHPLHFVARAGHPLAGRAKITPEQAFAYPTVAMSRIPPRVLEPMLARRRVGTARPFPSLEISNLEGVKRVLASSDAVAGLPLNCIRKELADRTLAILGRESWMTLRYGIVRLKSLPASGPVGTLCAYIREADGEAALTEMTLAERPSGSAAPARRARK